MLVNDVIEKIISDIKHICVIADLREKLQPRTEKARCCLRSSLLNDKDISDLFAAIDVTVESCTTTSPITATSNPAKSASSSKSVKNIPPIREPSRQIEPINDDLATATAHIVSKSAPPIPNHPESSRLSLATLDPNVTLTCPPVATSRKKTIKRKAAQNSGNESMPQSQSEAKRPRRMIFDVTCRDRGSSKRIPKASPISSKLSEVDAEQFLQKDDELDDAFPGSSIPGGEMAFSSINEHLSGDIGSGDGIAEQDLDLS